MRWEGTEEVIAVPVRLPWLLLLIAIPGPAFADVADVIDMPSSKWRATCKAQPIASRMERQRSATKRLTVHYTDTPKNYERTLAQKLCILFNYAATKVEGTKKNLWGDIPYHYYIASDGKLGEARDPYYIVDSNTAYNRDGHIAVVLEGNARDGINPAQKRKLFALLRELQLEWRVPKDRIGTHKNFAQTDCPGPAILKAVKEYKGDTSEVEPRPQPQPRPRPEPRPRPQPRPRPEPAPRCDVDECDSVKPRCWWGKVPVNKAPRGSCCPVWRCEYPANDGTGEEDEYSSRPASAARKWTPWASP